MKIIKKTIGFLIFVLTIIIVFILVNLLIGWVKVWSFSEYAKILESKDRETVSQDITRNPISRLWVFYDGIDNTQVELDSESEELLNNIDTLLPSDTLPDDSLDTDLSDDTTEVEPTFQSWAGNFVDSQDSVETVEDWSNPYDPDFEDEFNSFFAGE